MSFLKKLPKYYVAVSKEYESNQIEIQAIDQRIDQGNDWHECDCEYCDYVSAPALSTREEIELVAKQDKLVATQKDVKHLLKGMESYAKIYDIKLEGNK